MTTKFESEVPLLAVVNPFLLWFYRHGGEDPNWGGPIEQVTLGLTIHALAAKISDPTAAKAIQNIAAKQ